MLHTACMMDGSTRPWRISAAILLLASLLRLIAAVWWSTETQTDPDRYVALAQEVAAGRGLCRPESPVPTAYRPPGYPVALGLLLRVNLVPREVWIPLLNGVCDLITIIAVGWYCRWIAPSIRTAEWGMLLLAVDPLMLRYGPLAMTESLFTALATVAIVLLIWLTSPGETADRNVLRWAGLGLLCGAAALTRPSIWAFLGLAAVMIFIRQIRGVELHQRRWAGPLAALLMLVLTVSPWVWRNFVTLGEPLLTTSHGGYTLLLGNNPVFYAEVAEQPWGTVWSGESLNRWQNAMLTQMDADLGPDANELQQDRWQQRQARQAIAADPAGFRAAVWYRIRSFWSLTPRGSVSFAGTGWSSIIGLFYAAWFITALMGAVRGLWGKLPGQLWCWLFLITLQGVHLFYWTDTRMRMPLDPCLAIWAATAITGWTTTKPVTNPPAP
jgi:hypothetical protein